MFRFTGVFDGQPGAASETWRPFSYAVCVMSAPPPRVLFRARALLLDEAPWLTGGGLVVEGGRVVEVCGDAAAVRARRDAGDAAPRAGVEEGA